jgi:hypothetical protein
MVADSYLYRSAHDGDLLIALEKPEALDAQTQNRTMSRGIRDLKG